VCHLDAGLAQRDQARLGQLVQHGAQHGLIRGIGDQLGGLRPTSGVLGALAQLGQAHEHPTSDDLLRGRESLAEDALSRLGDCAPHPTAFGIAAQRQPPPGSAAPGFEQGVRQQRQRARLLAHVAQEHVDQSRLEQPALALGRALDGPPKLIGAHRAARAPSCRCWRHAAKRWGSRAKSIGESGRLPCRIRCKLRPVGGLASEPIRPTLCRTGSSSGATVRAHRS
jgi:hypothetical protein